MIPDPRRCLLCWNDVGHDLLRHLANMWDPLTLADVIAVERPMLHSAEEAADG